MAIEWRFILSVPTSAVDPTPVDTVIDEPIGFKDIVFNVMRDLRWHGIFFEASTSTLGFYGEAFNILLQEKQSYGIDATVIFTAESRCEGETEYEEVISGKLNFSSYSEVCGNECIIRMSVEQKTCAMVFKNRFDQKVDVDRNVAFDNMTNLVDYDLVNYEMPLAPQLIPISALADVALAGDLVSLDDQTLFAPFNQTLFIRPRYERVTDNSILTGYLEDPANVFQDPNNYQYLTPQILLEENDNCIQGVFSYSVRLKGTITMDVISETGTNDVSVFCMMDIWDGAGGAHTGILLHQVQVVSSMLDGVDYTFDQSFAGTFLFPSGQGLYAYLKVVNANGAIPVNDITADFSVNWDPETHFEVLNTKECPPTQAEVALIYELLSRLTESITDRCLTVKSNYYGRTDSEPFEYEEDGCGSLRVLTSGLKIRAATEKKFFCSMKEVMDGLRAIDNIGMGMEDEFLRIEPTEYFYNDVAIMDMPFIPEGRSEIDEALVYSNIKGGYSKWEIKSVKGIDEFNSAKEYRTSVKAVSNELDIRSNLIASGYIIENLRTSSLVNTGLTDNTYDNDVFIICVTRDIKDFVVEQGIVQNAANFFSPATVYNWRIRPIYNLMRWFKSISQVYVNLLNTASALFFTSGAGNYLAEGQITPGDACRLENQVIAENENIDFSKFEDLDAYPPIYKPEIISFEYPLSLKDYKNIKANPYGYINVQCGTGEVQKAFIQEVQYKPAEGKANFTLLKAY